MAAERKKVWSVRIPEEMAAWAETYAKDRGVGRAEVTAAAFAALREDARGEVPEVPSAEDAKTPEEELDEKRRFVKAVQDQLGSGSEYEGVGNCPGRPGKLGHLWKSFKDDPLRGCRFCDRKGRGPGGFLEEFTKQRVEVFARLRTPESIKAPKPKGRL